MTDLASDIFNRLRKRRSLIKLGLPVYEGRLLIEGIRSTPAVPTSSFNFQSHTYVLTEGPPFFKRMRWSGLHFRDCDLSDIGFFGARFANCTFERCQFRKAGFWNSAIEGVTFLRCDLSDCALGGVDSRRKNPNRYERVQFTNCRLSGSAHSCEQYLRCVFDNCEFSDVDFLGAVFDRCEFVGDLKDAVFRREMIPGKGRQKNSLSGCNFKEADVRWCQFLYIDLDPCMFNLGDDLIVLPRGPDDWRAWLEEGHITRTEGHQLYVREEAKCAGVPSIASRTVLLRSFTPEEVQALADLAGR